MDIAGIIGDGAWAVVKNILTLVVFALIVVAAIRLYIANRKHEEEVAFAEGRAIRLPDGRVLIFKTFERRQKYEAGLYNERWDFYYDDQAQKDAHESGDLVLHDGDLLTPEQKVQAERRLEEQRRREEEERRREEERRNRPRRRAFSAKSSAAIREGLYKVQQGQCAICRRRMAKGDFHIDHIVPVADGGSNEMQNLQLLCPRCNTSKGARPNSEVRREVRQRQRQRRR